MRVYKGTIKIEWAHCDPAGIVYYPHFYTWFDQATERLFSANRLSYAELNSEFDVPGAPLVETGAKYACTCRLGDTLAMESWVDEWCNKTFLIRHKFVHADGRVALEGFERRAWVVRVPGSLNGLKAACVPDAVRARFID
ncbi:MAG: acyl-CoA thioesterase [Alphaproteobacteria bacterium]